HGRRPPLRASFCQAPRYDYASDAIVGTSRRSWMTAIIKRAIRSTWKLVPLKSYVRPLARNIVSSRAMPGCWRRSLRLYRILSFDYGHLKSAALMRSVDAAGRPLPWITYPAIEFLKQL